MWICRGDGFCKYLNNTKACSGKLACGGVESLVGFQFYLAVIMANA
jgi:hypothetical protein